MNFLTGHLNIAGQRGVFTPCPSEPLAEEKPASFDINEGPIISVERSSSRPLVVGLRPEDLRVKPAGQAAKGNARLVLVEALGAESYLHLNAFGHRLVARVPKPVTYRVDEPFTLDWDDSSLHFFDPVSGDRVDS